MAEIHYRRAISMEDPEEAQPGPTQPLFEGELTMHLNDAPFLGSQPRSVEMYQAGTIRKVELDRTRLYDLIERASVELDYGGEIGRLGDSLEDASGKLRGIGRGDLADAIWRAWAGCIRTKIILTEATPSTKEA